MESKFNISPDHPAIPGHFPGNPVVPAVVMLQEAIRLLEQAEGVEICAVSQLRLLKPLKPGTEVSVQYEPKGELGWRVRLLAGEQLVAKGVFSGQPVVPGVPELSGFEPAAARDAAAAYRVLPHSGEMVLIDQFSVSGEGSCATEFASRANHPLATGGHLQPWVALEYAAQLYGCQSLLAVADADSAPMSGAYIVLVRSLQAWPGALYDSAPVTVSVKVVSEQGDAAQCEFEASVAGELWCRGAFTVLG